MPIYMIPDCNIESLKTKLSTIEKKCKKYNCAFTYRHISEQFIQTKVDLGNGYTQSMPVKYHEVEIEGTAIVASGWTPVAILSHTEFGNVIRQFDTTLELPDKYRYTSGVCEHCHTNRRRAETCVIYNKSTGEWKQVGKSCLKDFTGDISAEHVAWWESMFKTFTEMSDEGFTVYRGPKWFSVADVLAHAIVIINQFGFVSSQEPNSSASLTDDLYAANILGKVLPEKSILRKYTFDVEDPKVLDEVSGIIEWLTSVEADSDYIHSLQVIVRSKYIKATEWNILVSAVKAYRNHLKDLERARERQAAHDAMLGSKHVGEVGQRITIAIAKAELVTSFDSMYGTTFLYKFADTDGNIFSWFASTWIEDPETVVELVGTVKAHTVYEEVNETQLSRCKVTKRASHKLDKPGQSDIDEALDLLYSAE